MLIAAKRINQFVSSYKFSMTLPISDAQVIQRLWDKKQLQLKNPLVYSIFFSPLSSLLSQTLHKKVLSSHWTNHIVNEDKFQCSLKDFNLAHIYIPSETRLNKCLRVLTRKDEATIKIPVEILVFEGQNSLNDKDKVFYNKFENEYKPKGVRKFTIISGGKS